MYERDVIMLRFWFEVIDAGLEPGESLKHGYIDNVDVSQLASSPQKPNTKKKSKSF